MRVIELPIFGIKITTSIADSRPGGEIVFDDYLSAKCPKCRQKNCLYQCDGSHLGEVESEDDVITRIASNGAIQAVMALVLAHTVAGVDVEKREYLEGIETAMDAISNSF